MALNKKQFLMFMEERDRFVGKPHKVQRGPRCKKKKERRRTGTDAVGSDHGVAVAAGTNAANDSGVDVENRSPATHPNGEEAIAALPALLKVMGRSGRPRSVVGVVDNSFALATVAGNEAVSRREFLASDAEKFQYGEGSQHENGSSLSLRSIPIADSCAVIRRIANIAFIVEGKTGQNKVLHFPEIFFTST